MEARTEDHQHAQLIRDRSTAGIAYGADRGIEPYPRTTTRRIRPRNTHTAANAVASCLLEKFAYFLVAPDGCCVPHQRSRTPPCFSNPRIDFDVRILVVER